MTLPANPTPRTDRFTATGEEPIRPGTWWRLMDPDHEIAAGSCVKRRRPKRIASRA